MDNEIPGAVAICEKDNKFLMLKHKDGFWSFPGGKVEAEDASIKAGLVREIAEEMGISSEVYFLTDTGVVTRFTYGPEKPQRAGKQGVTYYFKLSFIKEVALVPLAEIREIGWFTKEEVLEKLFNKDMQNAFLQVLHV